MNWSKEVFARNLSYYVAASGKTQRDVAAEIGVSAPTMSDWVNGKIFPRIDKIEMLANYFGVQKSDLIESREKDDATEKKKIMQKLWDENFASVIWTEKETQELFHFAEYLLSKRKK